MVEVVPPLGGGGGGVGGGGRGGESSMEKRRKQVYGYAMGEIVLSDSDARVKAHIAELTTCADGWTRTGLSWPEAVAEATTELTVAYQVKELDPSWPQWYSKAAELEQVGKSLQAAAEAAETRCTFR